MTQEQISELHKRLVQTCIDYIKENELYEVSDIHFGADALNESAKDGAWMPCTDSYIKVYGVQDTETPIMNGKSIKLKEVYLIGEEL